ncbi:MAG: hypothetical protein IPK83_09475 [Planctomycetes bacterium]|nr:hypothetical protein [Planctomycetota bacterium]
MILPNRVTSVIGKISDIQAREAVSRFLREWQHKNHVFTTGSLKAAHRVPPPVKVALKLSQVPGADLASWAGDSSTMLEWTIEAIAKMYKKTGQLNPSIRKQLEIVIGKSR